MTDAMPGDRDRPAAVLDYIDRVAHQGERFQVLIATIDRLEAGGHAGNALRRQMGEQLTDAGLVRVVRRASTIAWWLRQQDRPLYLHRLAARGLTRSLASAAIGEPEVLPFADAGQLVTAPVKAAPGQQSRARYALDQKLLKLAGQPAEDVHAVEPALGSPAEIRRRRKELGVRGCDGLPPLTEADREYAIAQILKRGGSIRDLAHVLDCAVDTAAREMRRLRSERSRAA